MVDVCFLLATSLCGMDGFPILAHSLWNWFPCNCCSFVAVAVIQCTHHTSFPRLTGWFSSCRREGRWRGPPGSSARYLDSTRPRRPRPGSCPRCPRPAHLLGYRWRSTRWTQWWRLPLGPTPSPNIKGSVGDLWKTDTSCLAVFTEHWFEQLEQMLIIIIINNNSHDKTKSTMIGLIPVPQSSIAVWKHLEHSRETHRCNWWHVSQLWAWALSGFFESVQLM